MTSTRGRARKLERLRQGIQARLHPPLPAGIVATPGTCSGEPRIARTRVRARTIVSAFRRGWTVERIGAEFLLSSNEVEAALRWGLQAARRRVRA